MTPVERIIASIAPHDCLGCGGEGAIVCERCIAGLARPVPGRCYHCRAPNAAARTCAVCMRQGVLRHVWVRALYDGRAKELIHALKFGRVRAAADPVARLMQQCLPDPLPGYVVVPVPTATSRMRLRGCDQSVLLARYLSKHRLLPYRYALARMGQARQLGANRGVRKQQLLAAYRTVHPDGIRGKHILLVDDVMTAGATLEAAALCLRQSGAASVSAVVFAQKQ